MTIKVLFDINVLLDSFLIREEFYLDSFTALNLSKAGKLEGWVSANSFSTIYYFLRKGVGESSARHIIRQIMEFLSVIPVRQKTVAGACEMDLPDFEDNIQVACARQLDIDYILTRDTKDYIGSPIAAISPRAFIESWKSGSIFKEDVHVPFVDLGEQFHQIYDEVDNQISDVINRTAFIGGKYVSEFERNFATFCKAKHCIGVGNGTDALFIVLKALNIGPGDEVIIPANTFIATSEAVTMVGASVVFVDCDPDTYNIDVNLIHDKITSRTKAIIPVHLYGQPADMDPILEIVKKYNLFVIEDAAQAHGAIYYSGQKSEVKSRKQKKKMIGTLGDIACFSFYPGKNLGAYGDAGAIVTDNDEFATRARMFANHGRISKYGHDFEGINSRMDGIQAAILTVKLPYINEWNEKRHKNALLYNKLLQDVEDITIPKIRPTASHVFHLYVIRAKKRNELQGYLKEHGIATGIHYPTALPFLKAYDYLGHKPQDFPVAYQYQDEILSLPMYPELSAESIHFICSKIRDFYV